MDENLTAKLVRMANRDYNRLTNELAEGEGTYNTGHLASYVAILFKVTFANMEKAIGLDAARQSFKYAVDYMVNAMIDGAYDKENDRIK